MNRELVAFHCLSLAVGRGTPHWRMQAELSQRATSEENSEDRRLVEKNRKQTSWDRTGYGLAA